MSHRPRRTANEMAGHLRTPRWFVFILALGGLTFALYIKYGAAENTERMMEALVGDPELQLPTGFTEKENRSVQDDEALQIKYKPLGDNHDQLQQIEHE